MLNGRWVRLITLDTYRIAAPEQLRTYGEIIGVPVEVVSSVSELSEAMSTAAGMDRVLIDTTGHSPARVSQFAELAQYLSEKQEIEKHLVLSATTKSEDLREAVSGFECFAPDKLVFTKLDETSCYGGIVNELIASGKPLSYLTDGQKVPEDLITPTPSSVAGPAGSNEPGELSACRIKPPLLEKWYGNRVPSLE